MPFSGISGLSPQCTAWVQMVWGYLGPSVLLLATLERWRTEAEQIIPNTMADIHIVAAQQVSLNAGVP